MRLLIRQLEEDDQRAEFDCGDDPLDDYLHRFAWQNQVRNQIGVTWVGVEGDIIDAPFLPICRSQIDVRLHGDCRKLVEEMKGFHWMTCYGSHLRETGYALRKLGIDWLAIA